MDERRAVGLWGEIYAARYLRDNGYDIVCANYRCKFGEIDIIATNRKYIVFVEVKTRSGKMFASPAEYVDLKKQRKIAVTASLFLDKEKTDLFSRFDVIEVFLNDDHSLKNIVHYKDAFYSPI